MTREQVNISYLKEREIVVRIIGGVYYVTIAPESLTIAMTADMLHAFTELIERIYDDGYNKGYDNANDSLYMWRLGA